MSPVVRLIPASMLISIESIIALAWTSPEFSLSFTCFSCAYVPYESFTIFPSMSYRILLGMHPVVF